MQNPKFWPKYQTVEQKPTILTKTTQNFDKYWQKPKLLTKNPMIEANLDQKTQNFGKKAENVDQNQFSWPNNYWNCSEMAKLAQ